MTSFVRFQQQQHTTAPHIRTAVTILLSDYPQFLIAFISFVEFVVITSDKEVMFYPAFVCLFVSLSVFLFVC